MKTLVKIARFVAVVWGVAVSFWIMTELVVGATLHAILLGWIPGQMVRPDDAKACETTVAGIAPLAQGAAAARQTAILGWHLGFRMGYERVATDWGVNLDKGSLDVVGGAAYVLGVPVPAPPTAPRQEKRKAAFVDYLRIDPQCIAAIVARRYSNKTAALYRFAATMGYVYGRIMMLPEPLDATEATELRAYGSAAGIPEELWQPLMNDAPSEERMREIAEAVRKELEESVS